ncbi:hypothetical protein B0H12DRAFT_1141387 [Mycena haematopus]|nr:hypothetical protein B0H12DRAFT_1141387 [Mycena haematopus]
MMSTLDPTPSAAPDPLAPFGFPCFASPNSSKTGAASMTRTAHLIVQRTSLRPLQPCCTSTQIRWRRPSGAYRQLA